MKKIEAIVRCDDLEFLREQLADAGVQSVVALHAMCLGEPVQKRVFRGSSYAVGEAPVIKLEVLAAEEQLETILDILNAHTADGGIAVTSIERVIARAPELKRDSKQSGTLLSTSGHVRIERAPSLVDVIRAAAATAHFRFIGKPFAS